MKSFLHPEVSSLTGVKYYQPGEVLIQTLITEQLLNAERWQDTTAEKCDRYSISFGQPRSAGTYLFKGIFDDPLRQCRYNRALSDVKGSSDEVCIFLRLAFGDSSWLRRMDTTDVCMRIQTFDICSFLRLQRKNSLLSPNIRSDPNMQTTMTHPLSVR